MGLDSRRTIAESIDPYDYKLRTFISNVGYGLSKQVVIDDLLAHYIKDDVRREEVKKSLSTTYMPDFALGQPYTIVVNNEHENEMLNIILDVATRYHNLYCIKYNFNNEVNIMFYKFPTSFHKRCDKLGIDYSSFYTERVGLLPTPVLNTATFTMLQRTLNPKLCIPVTLRFDSYMG